MWHRKTIIRLMPFFAVLIVVGGIGPGRANAQLIQLGTVPNVPGYFLCQLGTNWLTSRENGWFNLDSNFQLVSSSTNVGIGSVTGIDYDPLTNQVVFYETNTSRLYRAAPNGQLLTYAFVGALSQANDISINPMDGSIWLARYGGQVEKRDATGNLLFAFPTGFNLSGIAVNPNDNSLFIMRADVNGTFEDEIYRFSMAGVNLGLVAPGAAIGGNGLGLEYDPNENRLYVKSQTPDMVTIFAVPEPSSIFLGMIAIGTVEIRRRKWLHWH